MTFRKPSFRLQPRLWDPNYLALAANREVMEVLCRCVSKSSLRVQDGVSERSRILDIGCGGKPFKLLFPSAWYVGTDISPIEATPDVVATNTALPFSDKVFDAAIASETLEHTSGYEAAVDELKRVTRDGGYIYISVPFIHPMHHHPYDFQRITEYKLMEMFTDQHVIVLRPSNTIFSTWIVALKFALVSALQLLPFSSTLVKMMAASLNAVALGIEAATAVISKLVMKTAGRMTDKLRSRIKHPRGLEGVLTSMPCGYALLVQMRKSEPQQ